MSAGPRNRTRAAQAGSGGIVFAALVVSFLLAGCGETLRGVKGDVTRVGRGIKTIFVSDPRPFR